MYLIIITGDMELLGGRNQYVFLDDREWNAEDLHKWVDTNRNTDDVYRLATDGDLRLACVECNSENKGLIDSAWNLKN